MTVTQITNTTEALSRNGNTKSLFRTISKQDTKKTFASNVMFMKNLKSWKNLGTVTQKLLLHPIQTH